MVPCCLPCPSTRTFMYWSASTWAARQQFENRAKGRNWHKYLWLPLFCSQSSLNVGGKGIRSWSYPRTGGKPPRLTICRRHSCQPHRDLPQWQAKHSMSDTLHSSFLKRCAHTPPQRTAHSSRETMLKGCSTLLLQPVDQCDQPNEIFLFEFGYSCRAYSSDLEARGSRMESWRLHFNMHGVSFGVPGLCLASQLLATHQQLQAKHNNSDMLYSFRGEQHIISTFFFPLPQPD